MAGEFAALGVFFIFIMLFYLVLIVGGILVTVFWIFMIVDAAKREYPNKDDKTMWILIVVLAGWIGAIIYYFTVKRKDVGFVKNNQQTNKNKNISKK